MRTCGYRLRVLTVYCLPQIAARRIAGTISDGSVDSLYTKTDIRVLQHILFGVRPNTEAAQRAATRKKVEGTPERPRLSVFRSGKHIYAQVIDDAAGKTLAAASTLDKELKGKTAATREGAAAVGKALAERAKKAGVSRVVFDRGGFLFHGRVKALADAAREGGLEF